MPRGTDPISTTPPSARGTTWPPPGGAPQVIVRLPDLRALEAPAPTLIVAIDPAHIEPLLSAGSPKPPVAKLDGPHWRHAPSESARPVAEQIIPFTKHPLVARAIKLARSRAELLLVLAGVLMLQIAIQFAWRTKPEAEPDVHQATGEPTLAVPLAATQPPVPVPSPIISETPAAPHTAETVASPPATEAVLETSQPVDPAVAPAAPSSPETGTTTDPRDVPPWESWPAQPKVAEPASNQAASNSPAKVSEPAVGPTLAPPQPGLTAARPKSIARLKGTISKPPVEPTHEHARRSLY
jgi:hypothetical protein